MLKLNFVQWWRGEAASAEEHKTKSYDSCCSTWFRVTWPWSADTEPVHMLRALLSRLVVTEELELHKHFSLKLFFFVICLSSSRSLRLCGQSTYQLTAAGALCSDNAFKYKKQNVQNQDCMDPLCSMTSDRIVMWEEKHIFIQVVSSC